MTVRIVTDSACDLPQAVADAHGIEIVPLTIRFGGTEFTDRLDLSVDEFWRRSAASAELPETAAPSPGQYEETFRRLAGAGADGVVCIALSGELSATIQSARLAADSVADTIRVEVVDSRSVTMGLGMIVLTAARRAEEGADVDTIVKEAVSLAERTRVWGALDTLENLKKGGRIGGAKALVASVLSIKPIIEVRNGKVEEGGKQRTRARALAFLIDKVRKQGPVENLAVMHADTDDVDAFIERLRPFAAGEIVVGDIGPVIGSHSGRGAIGVVFQLPA
ncbi:MAG: fatty acid kinase fatty acid binding subunit [Acidimicrobiaceae bacterium]|nr:fatty acid kinase fatty acid binding subunit [Acidimicrobiaceae bacterium]